MVWVISFIIALQNAFASIAPLTEIQVQKDESLLRVRLKESVPQLRVRGLDLKWYELSNARDFKSQWKPLIKPVLQSEWKVSCHQSNVWIEPLFQTKDIVTKRKIAVPNTAMVYSSAGIVFFDGRPYRQELRVYANGNKCEVINVISVEKYLDGLVNAEFSSKWDPRAVEAQVIAARTYAVYQAEFMRKNKNTHFDVDSTTKDQVYDGFFSEDYKASRAVSDTKGMVLVSKGTNAPIKAFYHSTCGGETELPESVWGQHFQGLRKKAKCPYCKSSPQFSWESIMSVNDLEKLITLGVKRDGTPPSLRSLPIKEVLHKSKLIKIEPVFNLNSNRAQSIELYYQSEDSTRRVFQWRTTAAYFRKWIGPLKLKSTYFEAEAQGSLSHGVERFVFKGKGYGHGVGLCQWGAKVMGEKGFNHKQILSHYYPDTKIRKIW